ncbi:MAG: YihY family inner membrane protein [Geobacter sp.]|nr:YihY family inner membrane protein [Geobacter sp.]
MSRKATKPSEIPVIDRLIRLVPEKYQGKRREAARYAQFLALILKDFVDDRCLLRASALTFTTILSIVPFCAIAFAVLKGLGVQNTLEPIIIEQVAAGLHEVVDRLITYINNTNVTSLGAIGAVTLIITVITLLGNIEEAFNAIWGVRETRSLYRKFSDYLSVVVSAPLLMFTAISLTTTLSSQTIVQWIIDRTYLGPAIVFFFKLVPYVSMWGALIFLYVFIPNTRVRFKSALAGGVIAGTLWQLAQWGYIHFQVGVAKYNAIYGTLAMVPIFMVWIYTSWLIVLFGVEVVYAHQNRRTFLHEVHGLLISHAVRERLGLAMMLEIAIAYQKGSPPWTAERLAEVLGIPVRTLTELLALFTGAGFLTQVAGEQPAWHPAKPLEQVRLAEIIDAVRNYGESYPVSLKFRGGDLLEELLTKLRKGAAEAIAGMSLHDLVEKVAGHGNAEESKPR